MRKLIVVVLISVLLGVPGYWIYSGNIPTYLVNTKAGNLIDDLSWKIWTYVALRNGEKPGKPAEAFYQALQEQDFYKAESYVEPGAVEYLNAELLENTSFKINEFKITEIKIRRDNSKVKAVVNNELAHEFSLHKNQGKWYVSDFGSDPDTEF